MANISVVIPAFNHDEFLADAIESILRSNVEVDEIIVVDDGSVDDTRSVARSFDEVTYVYQDNAGVSSALNRGIAQAQNDVIGILNDDDVFFANHLERAIINLARYSNDIYIAKCEVMGHGKKHDQMSDHLDASALTIQNSGFLRSLFEINWTVSSSSLVFKKSLALKVGGFHNFKMCHDLDFVIRTILWQGAPFGVSEQPTWKYRCHDANSGDSVSLIDQQAEILYSLTRSISHFESTDNLEALQNIIGYGISKRAVGAAWHKRPWEKESIMSISDSIASWVAEFNLLYPNFAKSD